MRNFFILMISSLLVQACSTVYSNVDLYPEQHSGAYSHEYVLTDTSSPVMQRITEFIDSTDKYIIAIWVHYNPDSMSSCEAKETSLDIIQYLRKHQVKRSRITVYTSPDAKKFYRKIMAAKAQEN